MAETDRNPETFRIILLGTGSPRPSLERHHPAALVQWGDGGHMLVDAGDGVVSQLLAAEVPLQEVHNVALTHMHWDHILGYPAFVWGSWNAGRLKLTVTGPIGTRDMHQQLVESYYREQAEWAMDLGFPRAGFDEITVRDVPVGWSESIDGCLVEAGPVYHPPMHALAYRYTYRGRSLVVTGDTAKCDELIDFCQGVDLLVIDACAAAPSPELPPERRRIIERLHEFHASPQDCIDIAAQAGVAKVVLTHHLPGVVPEFDSAGYAGEIVTGEDLDIIEI
ncbi:MAG: MBL fold metallo-hydrolase [Alphaproteobacteria bacterium]|jgi:ribonuclease Z|nr:MBL fold metallo-hydrolase [Alphaproteobacteria bacterium]